MTLSREIIVPVILCGGSGTRLWPASRENHPKQFLALMDDYSLLQNTMRRALRVCGGDASSVIAVTLAAMKDTVAQQLAEIDDAATAHILCEPSARNTGAAIALAAEYARRTFGDHVILWVLPADHHIANEAALAFSFAHALTAARDNRLVTFGINPTRPDTGYGYIRTGAANHAGTVHAVDSFVEKPDSQTAQDYLESGEYLWNSGMFLFSAKSVLDHYETLAPAILEGVRTAMNISMTDPCGTVYAQIEEQPFDKAIMEKSDHVSVIPCDPQWSDIGSWESLWAIRDKDMNDNVIEGRAACYNAQGCLIKSGDRLVAIAGLDDIVVVETDDALLITKKSDGDSMKSLIKALKSSGAPEMLSMPDKPVEQPWKLVKSLGNDASLNAFEITLKPGQNRLSSMHDTGFCLYTVLEGVATVSVGNTLKTLKAFESMNIPAGTEHKISNSGTTDLKMIEVRKTPEDGIFFGTVAPANNVKKMAQR